MPTQKRSNRDLRPVLVFLNGDLLAVPIPLEREEVTLGRALEANVRINDKMVSRKHARIKALPNPNNSYPDYQLTDLQSASGTLLNGEPLEQEILQNGDKITIGSQILRFEFLDEIDREYQKRIRRLLAHDDLTGLLSSRSFFSELRRESGQAKQEDQVFCVLMMDLDYFKM